MKVYCTKTERTLLSYTTLTRKDSMDSAERNVQWANVERYDELTELINQLIWAEESETITLNPSACNEFSLDYGATRDRFNEFLRAEVALLRIEIRCL